VNSFTNLDGFLSPAMATPEPASISLCLMGMASVGGWHWWRRRSPAVQAS